MIRFYDGNLLSIVDLNLSPIDLNTSRFLSHWKDIFIFKIAKGVRAISAYRCLPYQVLHINRI